MTSNHPTLDWLAGYASGTIEEAADAVIAAHLTLCPACRRDVARLEMIGGALLESETVSTAPDFSGAEAAMAAAMRPEAPAPRPTGTLHRLAPRPMADFIAARTGVVDVERLPWRFYGPGVERAVIETGADGTTAQLLRSQPGGTLAHHGHRSDEITYVLSGAYEDETGVYRTGDVQCGDESAPHQPVIISPDPCIALVVSEKPPAPTGLAARLAQLFLGR